MTKQIHEPESNPFYHNTLKLLKNYRNVVWNLEVSGSDLQSEFRAKYGSNLDECLNGLEAAGVSLAGTRIEGFARSLERSRKMRSSAAASGRRRNRLPGGASRPAAP